MISSYLRNHYVRMIYNRVYKPNSLFRGFLGWTAITELELSGNTVEKIDGVWVVNRKVVPEPDTDTGTPEPDLETPKNKGSIVQNITEKEAKEAWLSRIRGL
jgi:hypothetical protein